MFAAATACLLLIAACNLYPRNTLADCRLQCAHDGKPVACNDFCTCIHVDGRPLDACLDAYEKAQPDSVAAR